MHFKRSVWDINIFIIFLLIFLRLHQLLFAESTFSTCQNLIHLTVLGVLSILWAPNLSRHLLPHREFSFASHGPWLGPFHVFWSSNGQSQVFISYFPKSLPDTRQRSPWPRNHLCIPKGLEGMSHPGHRHPACSSTYRGLSPLYLQMKKRPLQCSEPKEYQSYKVISVFSQRNF